MNKTILCVFFMILVQIISSQGVKIEKSYVNLEVITAQTSQKYKVDIASGLRQPLNLTQSSQIKIQAKVSFSDQDFQPQFFSFRLRHSSFDNVSEPVLAQWDSEMSSFHALIDLGDPKHIKHLSGEYRLQIIISDDRLEQQLRKYIANAHVNFRHSLEKPQKSELHYVEPSIIMTQAPQKRIDPPQTFTIFVAILIIALFAIFLFGLKYQNVNINLFPMNGTGSILNFLFIGSLGLILWVLFQFWINWTFIQTFQCLIIIILPVALTANYALIHVKKE